MKKKKPFSELVIGLGCIALGVAVFIMAGDLQKVRLGIGPAGFPKFISVVLGILGLAQTVMALSSGVEAPKFDVDKKAATLFIAAVAAVVVYVMLVTTVGFVLLTPILMVVMMYLFGERHFGKMAVIAIVTTAIVWLLFTEVFMIFLPAGRLF
ncbi:MAG: tripartite tricarboxylate transporter TctB family protein [Clostridia bacterium]|nr:tripartite tricarboxylate transporter TctB family protein [Clostridia bacterium]